MIKATYFWSIFDQFLINRNIILKLKFCLFAFCSCCSCNCAHNASTRISSVRQNWICWWETVGFVEDFGRICGKSAILLFLLTSSTGSYLQLWRKQRYKREIANIFLLREIWKKYQRNKREIWKKSQRNKRKIWKKSQRNKRETSWKS